MGGFAGVRVCLRVISDLHDTAAPSPGKVTPKTKGREELRAAPSSRGSGKQNPGKVAQPQSLGESLMHRRQ